MENLTPTEKEKKVNEKAKSDNRKSFVRIKDNLNGEKETRNKR